MAITQDDFKKVWASTSSVPEYTFSDTDYKNGWEFVGNLPPTRAMWDELQRKNDEKMQFLQEKGSMCFDSVAGMKSSDLDAGQTVFTKGYYTVNDGGSAVYTIRAKTQDDVDDDGSIIFLDNGNVAELVTDGTVNVKQFGAVGDGITDDTIKIQKAVDFGSCVTFPVGTYMISEGILVHSNLMLVGEVGNKIIKDPTTTTHFASLYYYDIDNVLNNVKIKNLNIEGLKYWTGSSLSATTNDFGIRIWNANDVEVGGCNVSECGGCAISVNGTNVKIEKNIVTYTGTFTGEVPNYNFGISYDGENYTISHNTISGVIQGIISGLTNKKVRITENNISTNGQHGLYMEGGNGVVVDGNNIHDCPICGIKFQYDGNTDALPFQDIAITNNIIYNCIGQGVYVTDLSSAFKITNVVIANNVIDVTSRGIEALYIKGLVIDGNSITNASTYGLRARMIVDANIVGNKISGKSLSSIASYTGIYYDSSTDGTEGNIRIDGNIIIVTRDDSSAHACCGIRPSGGKDLVISNNLVLLEGSASSSDGIFMEGASRRISLYLFNNIVKNFRWDLRTTDATNITVGTNYYITKTGL